MRNFADFNPVLIVTEKEVVKAMFPGTCTAGETWKNETSSGKKSTCVIQKGHFADELAQFVNDAEAIGCKVVLLNFYS